MSYTPHAGMILRGTNAVRLATSWTSLEAGYIYIETDTKTIWYWDGSAWTQIVGGGSSSLFTSSTSGIVPASGGGTVNYLRADGAWTTPSGAGGGETNTASNVGTAGVGIFDAKSGVDLQFRKLNPLSSKLTIVLDAANKKVDFDVPDGSTTVKGAVELATDGEAIANVVVQGNDSRLSNSRAPTGSAGGDLTGTYPSPTVGANKIDYTKMMDMVANSVTGNPTAASADPQDIAIGTNTVLGRVAANIVAAQLVTAQIANDAIDNTKIANMAANTVKGNATASSADPAEIALSTNTILGRLAANIVAITGTQLTTLLDVFTSTLKGLVPSSGGGSTNFLRADGSWAVPAGASGVTVLARTVTDTDISNTTTETNMFLFNVPANTIGANKFIRVTMTGTFAANSGTPTITFRVYYGATVMFADVSFTISAVAPVGAWECVLYLSGHNSAGLQELAGRVTFGNRAAATTGIGDFGSTSPGPSHPLEGTAGEDTTTALDFKMSAQWSAANATYSWKVKTVIIELL